MVKIKIIKQIMPEFSPIEALMILILLAITFTNLKSQTPDNPGPWIPPLSNIVISGGVEKNKRLLSADSIGRYTDLYDKDDGSGRQRWLLKRSSDGQSYNIVVQAGTGVRKYLSVNAAGTKVDLYDKDDGSGRQRWLIEPIRQEKSSSFSPSTYKYHIVVRGGVKNNRKYLSTNAFGNIVDLFDSDDKSGRQLWKITPPDWNLLYIQASGGISPGTSFLGKTDNAMSTKLYPTDDNSGKQRWHIYNEPQKLDQWIRYEKVVRLPEKRGYGKHEREEDLRGGV